MSRIALRATTTILLASLTMLADFTPRELWRFDFEDGVLAAGQGLDWGDAPATIVPRGEGKCLQIAPGKPSVFATLFLTRPVTIEKNLILSFDHRSEIPAGFEGAYLGMTFMVGGKQAFWHSDIFSTEWRSVDVALGELKPTFGVDMVPGLVIDRIQLYARSKDTKEKGDNPCLLKVWFDNIRLHVGDVRITSVTGKPYICHNNPPLFDWRGPTAPGARLQYSRDPAFPEGETVTVRLDSPRPFYQPEQPLEPGNWFFRLETVGELYDGWSGSQQVVIPERTHAYRPPKLDSAALAVKPRPRLLVRLNPGGKPVGEAERERLVRQALGFVAQGIPEHPGPYVKDDPRWPNWIDWYGQVADRTTARIGRNLEQTAHAAILTRDERAIAAAKTLLLAACDWDPKGGSAERHGDLQAADLLQGMVACYDACADQLSPEEKARVLAIVEERVVQFYSRLSPFRINPAQNHPWRKNSVVADAALLLVGVLPAAEEWLDVTLQNFACRILPSMGFEGENLEGIMYWAYGVNMLAHFADLMRFQAGVEVYDHPWLAQTCRYPVYLAPPGAYAISFADNSSQGNVSMVGPYGTSLVGRLGQRVRDPYALWYAGIADDEVPARPPADIPQSKIYPHAGLAFFNTCLSEGLENVGVGLRCGPFDAGHQHDDLNGFAIHAYGDKLAIDGGYYDWWGSPHFKSYSITTLAHNTLLIDGKCQKREANGTLAQHFDSPGFGYAVGDASAPEVYHGLLKRFERRLLFLKPGFVVTHDLVEAADQPVRIDWLIHSHTDEAFPADSARRTFAIQRPLASLEGHILWPETVDMTVAKSFAVVPQKPRASVDLSWDEVQPEWTLTASDGDKHATGQFLAVMGIQRPDGNFVLERFSVPGAVGCEIRTDYGRWLILARQPGTAGPLTVQGVETDAELAALLLDPAGTPVNAFAAQATRLSYRGQSLFSSPQPTTWSLDQGRAPAPVAGSLVFAEQTMPMVGMEHPLPDGNLATWWATLQSPDRARCRVAVEGWTGKRPPRIRVNTKLLEGDEILLEAGTSCLSITGSGRFDRVVVAPRRYRAVPALVLPKDTRPAASDVVIDADAPGPVREHGNKGRTVEKIGAAGGKAYCHIDGPSQWAEWEFTVPADGHYQLLVRAASDAGAIDREILIDGAPFPAPDTMVRMAGTGGWCRTEDDWGWTQIANADGLPATVFLRQGTHTLRWTYVDASQNIDLFVLRPNP